VPTDPGSSDPDQSPDELPIPAHQRRWPATLTVLVVLGMQFALPLEMGGFPRAVLPGMEAVLLLPVAVSNPVRLVKDSRGVRIAGVALSLMLAIANAVTLGLLVVHVLNADSVGRMPAASLVRAGVLIWTTNVAAVAIAFWELDRGGPFARDPAHARPVQRPDLLFPQQTGVPGWDARGWRPGFGDYLFVAFTGATAFSPTDTLPLSFPAKLIMTLASGVSLITIGILVARAVNAV
jgi:hypothetical protein